MLMEWDCLVPLKHAGHRHDGNKYPCSHEGEAVAHADGITLGSQCHGSVATGLLLTRQEVLQFYLRKRYRLHVHDVQQCDCDVELEGRRA